MNDYFKKITRDSRVAAIAASSKYVIARVLREIGPEVSSIVEYGPGDGVLTRQLVARLPERGSVVGVERNPEFAAELREKIRDPRFVLHEGDAVAFAREHAAEAPHSIDVACSSIPLSLLSYADRDELISRTHTMLKKDGVFIVFHQYSLLVLPLLRKYFRTVDWYFEPRNVFPCFVMVARP